VVGFFLYIALTLWAKLAGPLVFYYADQYADQPASIFAPTYPLCYSDPSMWSEYGITNKRGRPASVATELNDHGMTGLIRANNDRRAAYLRLLELLHPEEGRIPPRWAGLPEDAAPPPRLYIVEGCVNLIEQLKNAPVKKEGRSEDLYEIVDPDWESRHGHAHASARYGAMSRPRPAGPADPGEPELRGLGEV
jgi:hypothetical protein